MKSVRGKVPGGVRTMRREMPPGERRGQQNERQNSVWIVVIVITDSCLVLNGVRSHGDLTVLCARDEPQAAIVNSGVLQGDPHPHNPAEGLRVQKRGVLMRRH